MGAAGCKQFHNSPMPNPRNPNKNKCTIYEGDYDPSDPSKNTVQGTGDFVVSDVCYPEGNTIDNVKGDGGDYCHRVSDIVDGNYEWEYGGRVKKGDGGGCEYNDSHPSSGQLLYGNYHPPLKARCCRGSCMIAGEKIKCKRNGYLGDPVVCCFLDNECQNELNFEDSCFQTVNKRRTCSPQYRNLKNQKCLDLIKPYCSGDKLFAGQSHWTELWIPDSSVDINSGQIDATKEDSDGSKKRLMKQPCLRALARAVYNDSGDVCTWEQFEKLDTFQGLIDGPGLSWAQDVLEAILQKYISEFGSPIGSINQDAYIQSSNFINFYWNLCKTFPLICKKSLSNFCSKTTVDDLISEPASVKWCGCYMPQAQYEKYEKYSVNRECTPYCNIEGNIPLVDADNVNKICTQTVCIMDEEVIKLSQVLSPDGINFNQVCNSCGGTKTNREFDGINGDINITVKNTNFIINNNSAHKDWAFTQFIPNSSKIEFWYKKKYDNAVTDKDGALYVRISGSSSRYPLVIPNVATLTYAKKTYTLNNIEGTLYYIIGIKTLYYENPKNILFAFVNSGNSLDVKWVIDSYITSFEDNNNKDPTYTISPIPGSTKNFDLGTITNKEWGNFSDSGKGTISMYNPSGEQKSIIENNVRQDNVENISNTCQCITDGTTIDILDSTVKSLNIKQNCGGTQCFDKKGNTIDCGSISDKIIDSVKNSIDDFGKELLRDKRALILEILIGITVLLFLVWLSIQYRVKMKR